MMKISKPVLTNDFLLSPVQFTSLSAIAFKNVKNIYDGNEKILLEYEHSSKIEASSRDWIGIFPRGWSTLQQYITFEWVSQSLPYGNNEQNKENGDLIRRAIHFCPKYHMGSVNGNSFYQFVYISKQIEVFGVSSYFRFDMSAIGDSSLELECLVPVSSKLHSTSVSDIGILMANKISSATSLDNRTLHTTSIHSLQNLETDGKTWPKTQVLMNISELKKGSPISRKSTGTGDALDPYSSHSEPVFPMSLPMTHCKKCFHFKRGGEFLRSQQVLQSKVGPRSEEASVFNGQRRTLGHEYLSENKLKIVMERNRVLEERTQEMKKELERVQAETKKLKTSFYNTNKEKVAYEKFVKDFIKSLEKDSVVRVVNGNTEFLVKKVNYVGMEEHPRDKKTSKRERELKAVIGLQEITIRNLISSLQEKAKSVQELNQTVKLAQAFSAARNDSRDYGSDAEETLDEVSSSDVTSEYEFSLTKPSPPEEVTVEDTDAVLDDIRRATEMELKDIGISRSLGKNSSRDSASDTGVPNLSVRSYQNQTEETRPKKPRLFDSVEDCWPFSKDAPKIFKRNLLDGERNLPNLHQVDEVPEPAFAEATPNKEKPQESSRPQSPEQVRREEEKGPCHLVTEGDCANCESYYDACEGFNTTPSPKESRTSTPREEAEEESPLNGETFAAEAQSEGEKQEKKNNFLVTAIVPQDLEVSPVRAEEDWLQAERADSDEQKVEVTEKAKKFTCQLSIDFGTKLSSEERDWSQKAIECGDTEEVNSSVGIIPFNAEAQLKSDPTSQKDKSLLCYKKANKCLEIKITQLDQKETPNKNFVHQKMVLKFENDSQSMEKESKSSKFEFNLAVSGITEDGKLSEENQLKPPLDEYESNTKTTPEPLWNDAADDILDESTRGETELGGQEAEGEEEKGDEILGESKRESVEVGLNLYEDSLRYEKNLEFLQQKKEENGTEEEVSKNKPTAILIQNGQTKLALIRYQ